VPLKLKANPSNPNSDYEEELSRESAPLNLNQIHQNYFPFQRKENNFKESVP